MNCILYKQDNNVPAVLIPTQEALSCYSIMEIAVKDVPSGKPFKIVDYSVLPQDVPQDAWLIDDVDLDDGIGGESNVFN